MANVKVIIEEIVKGGGNVKEVSKDLGNLEATSKRATSSSKTLSSSFTEFNSALSLVKQGLQYADQFLDATSGKTVEYANQVRLLGQINGQTAESNSRLIQTLDDYKISVDDITTASKKLKDNGLSPTVDTIAKLAEQYQKIQDPAEKLKFAQDNLGKSTKDWLEVLSQSPKVLREQAAGINENLILTQKQVDAARQLELAEDAKNDALQGVAITLGNKLVPIQKDFYNGINVTIRAIEIQTKTHVSSKVAIAQAADEIGREQQAMLQMRDAADQSSEAVDGLADSQKAAEDTAKNLSNVFSGLLSSMSSIQQANDEYTKTTSDLAKSDEELAGKKQHLTYEWYKQVQAGKDTVEAYDKYMESLTEIQNAEQDNAAKKAQLEKDTKKAANERLVSRAQELVSVDGVSEKEFEWLENLKVSHGLVSRAAADQAIAEEQAAQSLVSGFESTLPPMERSLQIMQEIAAYNGTRVSFGVNYYSNLPSSAGAVRSGNTFGTNGINYSQSFTSGQSNPMSVPNASHADGTAGWLTVPPGYPNDSYMAGLSSGEQYAVKPKGGSSGGDTYNIVINNPIPARSEDSIRQALIRKSATGRSS